MANLCNFIARVKGDKENVKKFLDGMEQKNGVWLGRGAELSIVDDDDFNDAWDDSDNSIEFSGICSWSIESSMVNNALSMRKQTETGEGNWGDLVEGTEYYTLFEYARKLGIEFEMYSTESGCCFAEHVAYINECGEIYESVPYNEVYLGHYSSLEECQADYPDITKEMWDEGWQGEGDGEVIELGGYGEYPEFSI